MKKPIFLFYFCFLGIIGCKETNTEPKSYIEITNKQQIDSITKTFVDREIYPFIYTRLEDSNGVVAYENLEKNQRLLANENIDGDSLFFRADTFIDYADTTNNQKRLLVAFHSVRMYKSDIQAYSDSLAYNFSDSSIGFFQEPILWTDSNQITGDTIIVFRNKLGIEYMDVINKGLVIEKDRNGLFNQISGRYIKALFDEGRLDKIYVDGNAQSIYYALEDSTQYSGVNEVFCGNMIINLDSNRVRSIKFMAQPKAIFYPLEKFPETKSKVPGFNWMNALKPQKIDF